MKLSAKIRVRLEGTTMNVGDVFGDVYWILVMIMDIGSVMCIVDRAGLVLIMGMGGIVMDQEAIRFWMMLVTGMKGALATCSIVTTVKEGPVRDRPNYVVARTARAQRGVALTRIVILVLTSFLASSRSLNVISPRMGTPIPLRRRRHAPLHDRVAAELGMQPTRARAPAEVGVLDAVDGSAGVMQMFMILLLMMAMKVLVVKQCGLCHGNDRPPGCTCPIRSGELTE